VDAVIVFLLLGVIWAVVLVPPWLQSRRESRPTASINTFHRQLWMLERTSPGRATTRRARVGAVAAYGPPARGLPAAYDDELAYGDDAYDDGYVTGDGDGRSDTYVDGFDPAFHDRADDDWIDGHDVVDRSTAGSAAPAGGYRRRRQVLSVVFAAAVVTLVPALAVGGTVPWAAQAAADVLLVGYVALLVRRRRVVIERDEKVRYLAPIRAPRPAVVVLHGGAAH
jgi:hypothetical protein